MICETQIAGKKGDRERLASLVVLRLLISMVFLGFACTKENKDQAAGTSPSKADQAKMLTILNGAAENYYRSAEKLLHPISGLPNFPQAAELLRKAAELGNAQAQYSIGMLIINGLVMPNQLNEAPVWIRKAADQGFPDAEFTLGLLYDKGGDLPKDPAKAGAWILKSANHGLADAQFAAGNMFTHGYDGAKIDYTEAVRWFEAAANQGHAKAAVELGGLYGLGSYLPKDSEASVRWFRKAADLGDALGQFNLGTMILKGEGAPPDMKEGLFWVKKSAEQGYSLAEGIFGSLLFAGKVVPKDAKEAYVLLTLSLKDQSSSDDPKDETGEKTLRRFNELLQKCRSELSAEALVEADSEVKLRSRKKNAPAATSQEIPSAQ